MATVTHSTMHHDHKQWISENDMWRCDLSSWQKELHQAQAAFKEVESASNEHATALQTHAAAIRLSEQDLRSHEHSLAEYERGEGGEELISLAQAHAKVGAKHKQQSEAHERIKKHHHDVIARMRLLQKALTKAI